MSSGKVRKALSLTLALCLALAALSGCARTGERREAAPTLPPARSAFRAPDGDGPVGQERTALLYLPDKNEMRLVPREVHLEAAELHETVRTLLEILLSTPSDEEVNHLGGDQTLTLYGDQPVEVSGSICTVNLGAGALKLSRSAFYQTCVALATTLSSLDEISFVNVLAADQSVGMDITGSLAMGSLTGHPDENLPVLWEQMEAKRTPLGEDQSRTPLTAMATLYCPMTDGQGIGCENRILTFPGQSPRQLAEGLLSAMGDVRRNQLADADLPDLEEYMLHAPLTSELEDGGRLITLSLSTWVGELLDRWQTDWPCLAAAITDTLTTFIPGVSAVLIRLGETPVTDIRGAFGVQTALGGLLRRNMFQPYLRGDTTVYLAWDGKLTPVSRPVDRRETENPRALLEELMKGPTLREAEEGWQATLPSDLGEEDILGVAAEGETLLVNLSDRFREEIQAWGPEGEALLCYSMVNTLCLNCQATRVVFYFEGEQVETIAGDIYWAGGFYYNPEL